MINKLSNLNKLLGLLIVGSVLVVIFGLAAYISPVWIKLSVPGASAGQGILFNYFSSPLLFYFGANKFADLPIDFKIAEVFFPIALIGIVFSIIRLAQSHRSFKVKPSGLDYVLKIQYQSFGFHFAALVLLLVSMSVYTSKALSSLKEPQVDLGQTFEQFGSSLSNLGHSGKRHVRSSNNNLFDNSLLSGSIPLSSNNNAFPSNNNIFPSNNNLFPSNNNQLPSDNNLLPSNNNPFSSDNNQLPSNNNLLPSNNSPFHPNIPLPSIKPFPSNNTIFSNGGHLSNIGDNHLLGFGGSSLGFSFYLGWFTFVLECLVIIVHILVYRNVTKNSVISDTVALA